MDISELKSQLLNSSAADDSRPVDVTVEDALLALARQGLREIDRLELVNSRWGGVETPEIDSISVTPDGTLCLEAVPPNQLAIVSDPNSWTASVFASNVVGYGSLSIEHGASSVVRMTFGSTTSSLAKVYGWRWTALPVTSRAGVWAAPLTFPGDRLPLVLQRGHGNMLLALENELVRGWRIESPRGAIFLVPRRGTWYLALVSSGDLADFEPVALVCTALAFVLGETFDVGVFQSVDHGGAAPGLVHLDLHLRIIDTQTNRTRPPALPFDCHPSWTANFIDSIVSFASTSTDAPILRCINLHFAASFGYIESQFLHSWMALEVLARWGIESGRIRDGGPLRLADHDRWLNWTNDHELEIKALAVPGKEQSLMSRVQGAELDRPTKVQRAFRGLGINWTDEMDDAEKVRHGVVHEGALSDGPIESQRDNARIGLVTTMLTALLAHFVQYRGPIADRSKTHFNRTDNCEPAYSAHGDRLARTMAINCFGRWRSERSDVLVC